MADERKRFQALYRAFTRATQMPDTAHRDAFLEGACYGSPRLCGELRRLLQLHESEPEGLMEDRIRATIEKAAKDLP